MTFGQQRIDRQRFPRLLAHERERLTWRHQPVDRESMKDVSELRVRQRELWIERDGPLERCSARAPWTRASDL